MVELATFARKSRVDGLAVKNRMITSLEARQLVQTVVSLICDTTSLNTGAHKGVCVQLTNHFITNLEKDLHT